jgi:DNA polymerase III alpha subunit
MFVPLWCRSEHSLGDGVAPVEALVHRAVALGFPALALTDVENLYGQVKLHHAARAAGLKPITGVEVRKGFCASQPGEEKGRLVLLARDREGYRALCRLITRRRSSPKATVDPLLSIDPHARGLWWLSEDPAALVDRGVPRGDVRYLLRKRGQATFPAVAAPEWVHLDAEDLELHRLLAAIRAGRLVRDVAVTGETWMPSAALDALFPADALEETARIAETCTLDLCEPLPEAPLGSDADVELARRCGTPAGDEARQRLAHELRELAERRLAPALLAAARIGDEARTRGIEFAARGSAASSLVVHRLGLSPIDPLRHGLLFERFLHPGRPDRPDVDLDFPSDRRDELIAWALAQQRPGEAALVSAHHTFGRRSAWREGLKALGMPPREVDAVANGFSTDDDPAPPELPHAFLDAAPLLARLVGRPRHLAAHPGGLVVSDHPLATFTALEWAPKGVPITQYDAQSLERLGVAKIDLLGNRALPALAEAARWVGAPVTARDSDPATLRALEAGDTIGCAQVESPVMRSTLRQLRLRDERDLISALALVRPGPASGAAKTAYLRRSNGDELVPQMDARIAPLLAGTFGVPLYDEDLIRIIAAATGVGLDAADALRSRIVAGEDVRDEFLDRAGRDALPIWRLIEGFAAYSFNKAHAASTAQLAWRSVFFKVHHPVEHACGVLNHYGGAYPLRTIAADFTRHGVRLLLPHVSWSRADTALEGRAVRIGLHALKHLGRRSVAAILEKRPFADVPELLERVRLTDAELRSLVLSGACDGLAPLDASVYPLAHQQLLDARAQRRSIAGPFAARPVGAKLQALHRIRNELELLGMHLTAHPMAVLRPDATDAGCVSTAELGFHPGGLVRIAAIVAAATQHRTRAGERMGFVTFEDEHGLIDAVLPAGPGLHTGLVSPGPFLVEGRVARVHRDLRLTVSRLLPFHERERPPPGQLSLFDQSTSGSSTSDSTSS